MGPAQAQVAASSCAAVADDAARLACYDRAFGRPPGPLAGQSKDDGAPQGQRAEAGAPIASRPAPARQAAAPAPAPVQATPLAQRWDLLAAPGSGDADARGPLFAPRPYKPVYILPATWTDSVNVRPSSPAPEHSLQEDLELRATETKYQLSLKTKLAHRVMGTPLSLWAGYTQSSRWQVYNGPASRPFRETNYEPELVAVVPLNLPLWGWDVRMASLSINHQSNGRSLPLSRSWNRLIASVAAERGPWLLELRPWQRIREAFDDDDNPDIEDHIGRGELVIGHYGERHALSLQLRHSFRSGVRSRGSAQLDWVFPLSGALHGYLQVFGGYGESMIDYNQRQTKLGLGVTIAGWR